MTRPTKSAKDAKSDRRLFSRGRTMRKVAIWGCLGIATLVGWFVVLIFHQPTPPVVSIDPVAAQRIEAQLQQIETDKTGTVQRVLPVDEGALNSVLQSYLAASHGGPEDPVTIQDMRVKLLEDRVHVYVVLNAHGKDLALDIETKLHTENGHVVVDPISARIGALSIPRSTLESAIQRMMSSPDSLQRLRLPDYLSDVHVAGSRIIATFK
jgi:uncharacterized protein YpmS